MAFNESHRFVGLPGDCESGWVDSSNYSKDQETCASISQDIRASVMNILCHSPGVGGQPDPLSTFFHLWNVPISPLSIASLSPQPIASFPAHFETSQTAQLTPSTPSPFSLQMESLAESPSWGYRRKQLGSPLQQNATLSPSHSLSSSPSHGPASPPTHGLSPLPHTPKRQLLPNFLSATMQQQKQRSPTDHPSSHHQQQQSVQVMASQPLFDTSVVKSPAQRSISPTRERRAYSAIPSSPIGTQPVASPPSSDREAASPPSPSASAPCLVQLTSDSATSGNPSEKPDMHHQHDVTAPQQQQQARLYGQAIASLGTAPPPQSPVCRLHSWATLLAGWWGFEPSNLGQHCKGDLRLLQQQQQQQHKQHDLPRHQPQHGKTRPSCGLPPRPPSRQQKGGSGGLMAGRGLGRSGSASNMLSAAGGGGGLAGMCAGSWLAVCSSLIGGGNGSRTYGRVGKNGVSARQVQEAWTSAFMVLLLLLLFCVLLIVPGKAAL